VNLNDIHRAIHTHKRAKRVGRGKGSGRGKTSGRGHKGQGARAGWSCSPVFEGGQMPLVRRIPKRGFHNRFAARVAIVNVGDLEHRFQAGDEVTPETLHAKDLCRGQFDALKVLGNGTLTKSLKVSAHRFSRSAVEKIRQAGGEAVVLPGKKPVTRKKKDEGRRMRDEG
jgi:large subunit ribosomal protein L15